VARIARRLGNQPYKGWPISPPAAGKATEAACYRNADDSGGKKDRGEPSGAADKGQERRRMKRNPIPLSHSTRFPCQTTQGNNGSQSEDHGAWKHLRSSFRRAASKPERLDEDPVGFPHSAIHKWFSDPATSPAIAVPVPVFNGMLAVARRRATVGAYSGSSNCPDFFLSIA
jgi:hypothetical protein